MLCVMEIADCCDEFWCRDWNCYSLQVLVCVMRFGLSVRVGIFCVLSCVYAGSIFIVKVMRLGFVGEVQKASNLGRRMSKVVAGLG